MDPHEQTAFFLNHRRTILWDLITSFSSELSDEPEGEGEEEGGEDLRAMPRCNPPPGKGGAGGKGAVFPSRRAPDTSK